MVSILFRALNHGFNIMRSSESKPLFWVLLLLSLFSVFYENQMWWELEGLVLLTSTEVNVLRHIDQQPIISHAHCQKPLVNLFFIFYTGGHCRPTHLPGVRRHHLRRTPPCGPPPGQGSQLNKINKQLSFSTEPEISMCDQSQGWKVRESFIFKKNNETLMIWKMGCLRVTNGRGIERRHWQ